MRNNERRRNSLSKLALNQLPAAMQGMIAEMI